MMKTAEILDLSHTLAKPLLEKTEYPWEALGSISDYIKELGPTLPEDEYDHPAEDVWIAKDAIVFDSAYIKGPCVIGHKTEVRQCAFIRGSALIGDGCVVGNSTEIKNAVLFDSVQVPHYNYVGDSILGYHAHMGAGSILSNVKADNKNVVVRFEEERFDSGRRKFGAILGDWCDIGCNSVLNPGTVVGCGSRVYPVSCVRGVIPEKHIYKNADNIVKITED